MRKALITKIVVMSLIAVFLIGALIYGLGNGFGVKDMINSNLKNTNSSMVNTYEYSQPVDHFDSIDIDWISGNVWVRYYDGDVIKITEQTSRAVEENEMLVMEADGSALKIRWGQKKIFLGIFNLLNKQLTVELPRSMVLDTVKINSVSAGVTAEALSLGTLKMSSVSGAVDASGARGEEVNLSSTSGKIYAGDVFADELTAHTTSGKISLESAVGIDSDVSTVSGSIGIKGTFQNLRAKTVSGSISAVTDVLIDEVRLESVSGSVELTVPEDTSAKVNYSSISGNFNTSFNNGASGKKGEISIGAGAGEIRFSTTSGSMSLKSGIKSVSVPTPQPAPTPAPEEE